MINPFAARPKDQYVHWCRECGKNTYWIGNICQPCKYVQKERERQGLIVAFCILIIVVCVFKVAISV